jgi:NADPH:quinone reductase-like Zn-dependent oxidoreductase
VVAGVAGVGHAAVQVAAAGGADVIATAGSAAARERVADLGAAAVLDYHSDTLAADVLDATDGEGVDVVLDHLLEQYLEVDLEVAAQGGQVVSVMGEVAAASGFPLRQKEVTLRGMSLGNRAERTPILERLARLLERGDLVPQVADTYGFDEVAQAHRDVLAGGYVGKLVVTP